MKKAVFLIFLLTGLFVPWATQAQSDPPSSCTIEYELVDSYGDGWNGAAILVYDNDETELLATWTITNGRTASGTLSVGHSQNLRLEWQSGNYDEECSYTVSVTGGDIISEGTGAMSTTSYQVSCPTCFKPANLAVNYTQGANSATLTWNASPSASSYTIYVDDITGDASLVDGASTNTNSYPITGLTLEHEYVISVNAVCGPDDESIYSGITFTPSDRIRIGEGTSFSNMLPTNVIYSYSLTEQIYTVDELGSAGTIENLEFYKTDNNECSRDLEIYMVSTPIENFSYDGWVYVTSSDLVYSGTVSFYNDAWTSIELDIPFEYDGVNNVAIVVNDLTGIDMWTESSFLTFESGSDPQTYSFFTNYATFDPVSNMDAAYNLMYQEETWELTSVKNQIRILKSDPPTCYRPTGIAVSDVSNTSVTLSWTERNTTPATQWQVQYSTSDDFTGGISIMVNTNPTTSLIGLTAGTTYYARVRAVCGTSDQSNWSAPISFTTAYCSFEDQCEIYYNLYPVNGYGYNYGYINVIDDATGRLLDRWVPDYGGGYEEGEKDASDYTGVLSGLCPGRVLLFEWDETGMGEIIDYKSTKDGEEEGPSFVVYDRNEEEILTSDDELPFYWTVNCNEVTCSRPTGLMVESVDMTTATVSWDAVEGVTYNIKVNDDIYTNVGTPTLSIYTLNHTIMNLEGNTTYTVSLQANCGTTDGLSSWTRPVTFTTDPCPDMCEISYELSDNYNWYGYQLQVWDADADTQITSWGGGESYIGSLRVCDGSRLRFTFVRIYNYYNASSCSYAVYDVNHQVIFSGSGYMSDVYYTVNCHACPMPTELEVSNVTSSSATLSWEAPGGATTPQSYVVRYREVLGETPIFFEDFEHGMDGWTTIGTDAVEHPWQIFNMSSNNMSPHSGTQYVCSGENASSPDAWLVSPLVPLQGTLKLWTCSTHRYYGQSFSVYLSTNTTGVPSVADFTQIANFQAPASYASSPSSINLSEYTQAANGYIAIKCTGNAGIGLVVDDFGILVTPNEGAWTEATVSDETSYTISGLLPNTTYQWGVTSVCDDDNESQPVTLSPIQTEPYSFDISLERWYAISAPVYDGWYHNYYSFDNYYSTHVLYSYSESDGTWINKTSTYLERGRGYIFNQYRGDDNDGSVTSATITFNGIPNKGNYPNAQTLTNSCQDVTLRGYNLIGNPYTHPIYKGSAFPSTGLCSGYYSLGTDGSWQANMDNTPIAMGQGVLVQVAGNVTGPLSLSFTDVATPVGSKGADDHGLRFTIEGFGHSDVAYALLSEGEGLGKIGHLAENLPTLSIPVADRRYAIAHLGADCRQFDLHFRAAASGSHTLTLSAASRPAYLHLIDRLTGADIDLLAAGSYTFDATPVDASNRFLVKLAPGNEAYNGFFAFQAGDHLLIEGSGTLQVFDVMGRQLFIREVSGQLSLPNTQFPGPGVYILRLGEKSQKLVIK